MKYPDFYTSLTDNNLPSGNLIIKPFNERRSAVLFDLDHTIIRPHDGRIFPLNIDDWEFIPEFNNFLHSLVEEYPNAFFCIVSNQGGIEHGYFTPEQIISKFNFISSKIANLKFNLKGKSFRIRLPWIFCPVTNSSFSKPNTGMSTYLADTLNLSLKDSVYVGDMLSDLHFARRSNIGTYYHYKQGVYKEAYNPNRDKASILEEDL